MTTIVTMIRHNVPVPVTRVVEVPTRPQ